jgi:hypothetical protein
MKTEEWNRFYKTLPGMEPDAVYKKGNTNDAKDILNDRAFVLWLEKEPERTYDYVGKPKGTTCLIGQYLNSHGLNPIIVTPFYFLTPNGTEYELPRMWDLVSWTHPRTIKEALIRAKEILKDL